MDILIVTSTDPSSQNDNKVAQKEALLIGKYDKKIVHNDPVNGPTILIKSSPLTIEGTNTNIDAPITAYERGEITHQRVSSSDAATAPVPNKNGIITTYRYSDDYYSYQEWKSIASTNKFIRNWNTSTNSWDEWGQ